GTPITTSKVRSLQQVMKEHVLTVQAARNELAAERGIPNWQVPVSDVRGHPDVKALGIAEDQIEQALPMYLRATESQLASIQELKEFSGINLNDPENLPTYTVLRTDAMGGVPQYLPLNEAYKDLTVFKIKRVTPAGASVPGQPPATETKTTEHWILVADPKKFEADVQATKNAEGGVQEEILHREPASIFRNNEGRLAFGIEGIDNVYSFEQRMPNDQIYQYSEADLKKFREAMEQKQKEASALLQNTQNMSQEEQRKVFEDYQRLIGEAQGAMPEAVQPELAVVDHQEVPWFMFLAAIAFGVFMAFAIELLTDYYVSTHKKPVQEVAGVSTAGPAPMIIQGFALAAESSVFSVFAIVVALIAPLLFFPPDLYGSYILSFYGIALVGLGLLTTTGYILAMDTFGPISDNAQGVFEMSGAGHESPTGAKAVQRLDAAGNTTKALTKGFAIATAVVAAVALFHSYVESARLTDLGLRLEIPEIFLGLLIGGAAPYLFSAFAINAVGRASFDLINEVRRQFRADPGIMAGTSKPDYGSCVSIVTAAAQKELLGPGILAIALPAAVAFGFSIGKEPIMIGGSAYNLTGAQALGGFLAGAILSGQLMAVLLANSGGMWDNAKKLIEDGLYGGKGSEAHKAGVVCDTVGDPFKDTAGPALNPLIKVMNLVALLLAPVVIQPFGDSTLATITIVCLVALAFSIWWSKRSSMSTAMEAAASAAAATPEASDEGNVQAALADAAKETPKRAKRKITVEDEEPPVE
ncbi:MAG TPA: sodium/proton-translocating pyrophosphatase, partial [Fimbriimonadaceae bacterium]|nr:sodium/proton-translocating pyrophosphatase [Fimbriimonadaceae bacterium]